MYQAFFCLGQRAVEGFSSQLFETLKPSCLSMLALYWWTDLHFLRIFLQNTDTTMLYVYYWTGEPSHGS